MNDAVVREARFRLEPVISQLCAAGIPELTPASLVYQAIDMGWLFNPESCCVEMIGGIKSSDQEPVWCLSIHRCMCCGEFSYMPSRIDDGERLEVDAPGSAWVSAEQTIAHLNLLCSEAPAN